MEGKDEKLDITPELVLICRKVIRQYAKQIGMIATNASYIQNASMTLPDARNYGRTSAYEKNQRNVQTFGRYEL